MTAPIQTHWPGASTEYYAASLFLARGQQVFWPSMQQSAVDFIIERGGRLLRVQVKRAGKHVKRSDKLAVRLDQYRGARPFDLLVCVCPLGRVWEIPARHTTVPTILIESPRWSRWRIA